MTPDWTSEEREALKSVDELGALSCPTGHARAMLCHAAVVLARSLRAAKAELEAEKRSLARSQACDEEHLQYAKQMRAEADALRKELEHRNLEHQDYLSIQRINAELRGQLAAAREALERARIIVEEQGDLDVAANHYRESFNTVAPIIALHQLRSGLASAIPTPPEQGKEPPYPQILGSYVGGNETCGCGEKRTHNSDSELGLCSHERPFCHDTPECSMEQGKACDHDSRVNCSSCREDRQDGR